MSRKAATEVVQFTLHHFGYSPELVQRTADQVVELFEQTKLDAWTEQVCTGCVLTPGQCPFLPEDTTVRNLHVLRIVYSRVICEAKQPIPRP